MSVLTDLQPGDRVVVVSKEFLDSGYSLVGVITECRPKQNGYIVLPLGAETEFKNTTQGFGWGYTELDYCRPTIADRLLDPIV